MRTKTLLLAAATLAVSLVASQAQVYSGIVGYVNNAVPAHGFAFFGNQLVNGSDASQTNNNIQAVLTTGLISDPNGVTNTTLYYYNGSGYNVYAYYLAADANYNFGGGQTTNGWYDGSGNLANVSLVQGAGGGDFLYNPYSAALTNITIVGSVVQGTNIYTVSHGFNTYTLPEPVATNLDSALINFPGTSDPNGVTNDVYYGYNGSGYIVLTYFTGSDANYNFGNGETISGWYDANGTLQDTNAADWPQVDQAFWIKHAATGTETWTNVFVAQ